MSMLCIVVLGLLVGILSVTTMKYKNDYQKAMILLDNAKMKERISKGNYDVMQQGYDLIHDKYIVLEEKYYAMEKEHNIIFRNLEEDAMCLVKAKMAHKDLCSKLSNDSIEIANKVAKAKLIYDSTSENNYNVRTEEITLSLFSDYNSNEQCSFLYDYLNNKYGLNLNGSDIRTNIIFTALHELGHYIDYSNKDNLDAYREINLNQKEALEDMEYGPKCWKAYRETLEESFADCFAIEFMIKHYPELV